MATQITPPDKLVVVEECVGVCLGGGDELVRFLPAGLVVEYVNAEKLEIKTPDGALVSVERKYLRKYREL